MRIADGALEVVARLGAKACTDDPFDCQLQGGPQQVENLIQQKARLYISQARVLTGQTLENLRTLTAGLTKFPGRKTLVFLTEGFFVEESRSALQLIAAQAARAGTTIYTIDARGLTNGSGINPDVLKASRARSTVFDTGEDGPAILTSGTGGFVVRNIEDMSRAFGMIVRDTSTYYVIGYAPENTKMDGRFRKIEVRSRKPHLSIRARKGYVAYELPPPSYDWKR
jgi:VWFA-related protein